MDTPQNISESGKSDLKEDNISFIKSAWGSLRNAIIGCSAAVLFGIAVLLMSILSVTSPQAVFPKEESSPSGEVVVTQEVKVEDQKVDYYLPYPGILPDNPVYKLKALRDKVRWWLTFDEGKKAQRELLYADKRINAAIALIEGGKVDLGVDTATKAEKYLEQSVNRTIKLQKIGQDVDSMLLTLEKATAKHEEILEVQLLPKSNGSVGIQNASKLAKSLQEQVAQALLE